MKRRVFVDFETDAIRARPAYPPRPVGVAVADGRRKAYYSWGHPAGNNTTVEAATTRLKDLWQDPDVELVFHNAKFDLDVGRVHLGLALPPPDRCHDTLLLLYLDDPRAPDLKLKAAAERLLNLPPEERDAVRAWLVDAGIVRRNDGDWGAAISAAPGGVVGPYALGDVARTAGLFRLLHPKIVKRGMAAAYDRERRLMPVLLANEARGNRVDLPLLEADVARYARHLGQVDAWLRRKLGAEDLDLDKNGPLADALGASGQVTEWAQTPTGQRSTSLKNLEIRDGDVRNALVYRSKLATDLRTFMLPWREQARQTGGVIYTNWNQTRSTEDRGTRTGRMSSNPNLQNIPTETQPLRLPLRVAPLPLMRRYVIGDDDGHLVGSRDINQQELRALAHYEDGALLSAYRADPQLDVHTFATTLVNRMLGSSYGRKPIKNLGFGLIYGMGLDRLAATMELDPDNARRVRGAYLAILPGLKDLITRLKQRARLGQPIRTWGGREYYVEAPRLVDGKLRTFEYKMLNVLVQGSCADATKEWMLRYDGVKKHGRFMVQVHDQLLISAPKRAMRAELRLLGETARSLEFDVPMLSDASQGPSWGELESVT